MDREEEGVRYMQTNLAKKDLRGHSDLKEISEG